MFWKKKADTPPKSKLILGMILLSDNHSFDVDSFINNFNNSYDHKIQEPAGDNASFVFIVDGETVAIAHMSAPIPLKEIANTAKYAYNWKSVIEDTKEHQSHLLVSLIKGEQDPIKRFKIFTQVLCSLLRTTNAIGVYKGAQSLLIPKANYLKEAAAMSDKYLPLNLWIYFGLHMTSKGNSGYTYGLKELNKTELEIVNSSKSIADIRGFLFNIAHYVLDHDVTFENGQTLGGSEEEKIAITLSKGALIEGDTFKIAY